MATGAGTPAAAEAGVGHAHHVDGLGVAASRSQWIQAHCSRRLATSRNDLSTPRPFETAVSCSSGNLREDLAEHPAKRSLVDPGLPGLSFHGAHLVPMAEGLGLLHQGHAGSFPAASATRAVSTRREIMPLQSQIQTPIFGSCVSSILVPPEGFVSISTLLPYPSAG